MNRSKILLPFLLLITLMLMFLTVTARAEFQSISVNTIVASVTISTTPAQNAVSLEGTHILNCQVKDASFGNSAQGCINDVPYADGPTWVVPRENGTSIISLAEAHAATSDAKFKAGALLCAEYLKNRQEADGAWCKQYDEKQHAIVDKNKSPSEAGSAIAAFYKIHVMGWEDTSHQYYGNARKAAEFIILCIDNKPGAVNGLAGSGKEYGNTGNSDILGEYRWGSWSWVSDNCYAYLGLMYVKAWAAAQGDTEFSAKCGTYAQGLLRGINTYLKNPNNAVWYRVVGSNSELVSESAKIDALCFYPQKYDLPLPQYGTPAVAQWMIDNLQETTGSVADGCGAFKWKDAGTLQESDRRSPGFSFEAWLALVDIPGTASQHARAQAKTWWETVNNTGGRGQLWDTANGGFIDWYDPDGSPSGYVAPSYQRFIDTSSNNILVNRGGFNYAMGLVFPSIVAEMQIAHKSLERISPQASVVVATGTVTATSGLQSVTAYYYKDTDASISTAAVAVTGSPTTYGFRVSMGIGSAAGAQYFYYRLMTVDQSGNIATWPAGEGVFRQVSIDPTYAATIGATGGNISLPNEDPSGGQTSLQFPSGALDEGTKITITEIAPSDTASMPRNALSISGGATPVAVYSFGPEGLVFNAPVVMSLLFQDRNHDGIVDGTSLPIASLRIFWWDGYEWRLMGGTVNPQTNTVSCDIRHFSMYAIFPYGAPSDNDYRPKERIITPALADKINDYATFGALDTSDTVTIYDVNGRRVRQLSGSSVWDGRDDDNAIVESGLYIYQIKKSGKLISGTIVVAK